MRVFVLVSALLLSSSVHAQESMGNVPLPLPRPQDETAAPSIAPSISANPLVDAVLQPEKSSDKSDEEAPAVAKPDRPPRIYQAACPALLDGLIDGEMLPPIHEKACGLQSPLLVRALFVKGQRVGLTTPVTTNCQMATIMAQWVGQVSGYSQSIFNKPVTSVTTGTSYMCRPRNNQPGADQSEHGFANALDVTGFVIGDNQQISLPKNWDIDTPEGRTMRFAHDAACSQFTTVLGPEANALHRDHLHVDLGCHGKTCTYRLCE